jgi:predicted transglutaminase-like cysteine proteinase
MKLTGLAFAIELVLPLCTAVYGEELRRNPVHTLTPFAMQVFCSREPGECRMAKNAIAQWNTELAVLLDLVNDQVNKNIRPRADPGSGWRINPAYGDCNDYVLTKRSRLISLGIPAGALRIGVTATRGGIPHAILIVRTSNGDYVLDNLTGDIRSLARSGYSVRMMSTANPLKWVAG